MRAQEHRADDRALSRFQFIEQRLPDLEEQARLSDSRPADDREGGAVTDAIEYLVSKCPPAEEHRRVANGSREIVPIHCYSRPSQDRLNQRRNNGIRSAYRVPVRRTRPVNSISPSAWSLTMSGSQTRVRPLRGCRIDRHRLRPQPPIVSTIRARHDARDSLSTIPRKYSPRCAR